MILLKSEFMWEPQLIRNFGLHWFCQMHTWKTFESSVKSRVWESIMYFTYTWRVLRSALWKLVQDCIIPLTWCLVFTWEHRIKMGEEGTIEMVLSWYLCTFFHFTSEALISQSLPIWKRSMPISNQLTLSLSANSH